MFRTGSAPRRRIAGKARRGSRFTTPILRESPDRVSYRTRRGRSTNFRACPRRSASMELAGVRRGCPRQQKDSLNDRNWRRPSGLERKNRRGFLGGVCIAVVLSDAIRRGTPAVSSRVPRVAVPTTVVRPVARSVIRVVATIIRAVAIARIRRVRTQPEPAIADGDSTAAIVVRGVAAVVPRRRVPAGDDNLGFCRIGVEARRTRARRPPPREAGTYASDVASIGSGGPGVGSSGDALHSIHYKLSEYLFFIFFDYITGSLKGARSARYFPRLVKDDEN